MIRKCGTRDFDSIWEIVNDGAQAYRGVIPADRYADPYMPGEELKCQIDEGVVFWGCEENGTLLAVMGIQKVEDVTLIRHAYVRTSHQKQGLGGRLLKHLLGSTNDPVLIGTWADASWAIQFYERHGFERVAYEEKERLLRKYWNVPVRQIETSVVLADQKWRGTQ